MAPEVPVLGSLLELFERPAWHREATCRGADPELSQSGAAVATSRPWPAASGVRFVSSASPQPSRWRRRAGGGAGRRSGDGGVCGVERREGASEAVSSEGRSGAA